MNNLKQKNVIYGQDQKDVLPHAGKGDSVVLVQNSNITDARLNNAFQQLINNDLYIENRLAAGLNYQPGPEGVMTASAVSALPNGSKRWVKTDDYSEPLQIYKKVDAPLAQSVGLVRGPAVKFIAPVGGAVFVAFDDKLMYGAGGGLTECKDAAGGSVSATGCCDGDGGAFFVSDQSVYRLAQRYGSGTDGAAYSLQKLNSAPIANGLRCVQYDAAGDMLYVGGQDGFIARSGYSSQTSAVQFVQDIKFCKSDVYGGDENPPYEYVDDITVNALQILDGRDYSVNAGQRQTNVIAATSGGMFRSDTRFFLDVKTADNFSGWRCIDIVQHEGTVYAIFQQNGSDGHWGVYRQTDAGSMLFSEYSLSSEFGGSSPVGLVSHSSGLYVVCKDGIYRYILLGDSPKCEVDYRMQDVEVEAAAVATLFGKRLVFVASGGTICYYSDSAKVRTFQIDGCVAVRQIVAQARIGEAGSLNVYVIGNAESSGLQLFAVYIGFGAQKKTDGEIDSVELAQPDIEQAGCGEQCYYFKDGIIYNKETGQRKRLGDIKAHQVEYLPDISSLALATTDGLYVLSANTLDIEYRGAEGADVKFVAQRGSTVCFASSSDVSAAYIQSLDAPILVGELPAGNEISGLATDGNRVYVLGPGEDGTGEISSAQFYCERDIAIGGQEEMDPDGQDGNDGDDGTIESTVFLSFPAMPFMAETSCGTALGISAGQAYRLAYYDGSDPTCKPVSFPDESDGSISAFCLVPDQNKKYVFIASSGGVRQYKYSADDFDPDDAGGLEEVDHCQLTGVSRIAYSKSVNRVYVQADGTGLSACEPTDQGMQFQSVDIQGDDGRKVLLQAADFSVFIASLAASDDSTLSIRIYKESSEGNPFETIVDGHVSGNYIDINYIDIQMLSGVIQEQSREASNYVFFLSQSGGVEVYAITETQGLRWIYRFRNPINSGEDAADIPMRLFFAYMPYINAQPQSPFYDYTRKQAYNGKDYYNWPILVMQESSHKYAYLDFEASPDIKCGQLRSTNIKQCVSIGKNDKNDSSIYYVKQESEGVGVYLIDDDAPKYRDSGSTGAWYVGDKCFFQKNGGGLVYYKEGGSRSYSIAGGGRYELADCAGEAGKKTYYFVRSDGDRKNLYKGVSIAVHPLVHGPSSLTVSYTGAVGGDNPLPVRLVKGKTYAGLVCQNGSGDSGSAPARGLYVLYSAGDSSLSACRASFDRRFSTGAEEIVSAEGIVPVGDVLDEIIVYADKYLHVARVLESNLIMDGSGSSVIPIVGTLPWTELGDSFAEGISASAKLGSWRYVTTGASLSSFAEGSPGIAMKILSPVMKGDNVNARSFYQTGQNMFLVATDKGLYRYQHIEGAPVVRRLSPGAGYDVAQITSYNSIGGAEVYVMANALDGYLYSSENCRIWKKWFRPAPVEAQLSAAYQKNAHEWYLGASSGLYKTMYRYDEVDDLAKFTESDLYSLYSEMLSSGVSGMCEDEISEHELDESYMSGHLSSLVHDINQNLLSVNFDGLQSSGWQHHTNTIIADEYSVSNDIVFEQFWGSNADWNLTLSVENMLTSTANAKFTYLLRRWMSGVTELYVHIPTTNTYYINHVPSTPNYNIDGDRAELSALNVMQFGQDKIVFSHDPNAPGVYTTIRLALSKYAFSIDQMLEVQACGNSLPLKIYKETIRENGSDNDFQAAQYFNSYVAPTVLTSTVDQPDGDDYIFNFACFGSDEQVIKLQFIDTVNRFDKEYCRLVFDSNGLNSDPDTFVKQRIRLDGQPYSLRRNQYRWPNDAKLFAGWTFTARPADNPEDVSKLNGFYTDRQQITSQEIFERCDGVRPGQDVKIYAVWTAYQFSESDTTLLVSPRPGKATFSVGSVGLSDSERMDGKVIVKFEEVD